MTDDIILPGGPRLIQNSDGTMRVVGARAEPPLTKTIDRTHPGPYRIKPREVILAAARMQRDGLSLKAIRAELDLLPHVTDEQLQFAINVGMVWLAEDIAAGLEPEESKVTFEVRPEDEADVRATVESMLADGPVAELDDDLVLD